MQPPLAGREEEYRLVVNFLQRRLHEATFTKVLFLCGPCGAGKTSTLMRVMPKQFTALSVGPIVGGPSATVTPADQPPSPEREHHTFVPSADSGSSVAGISSTEPNRTFRACYINCADRTAKDLVTQCCELLTHHRQKESSLRPLRLALLNAVLQKSKQRVEMEVTRALAQCREAAAALRSGAPLDISDVLPVFVLDEADFAKPSASHALRWMARLSQLYPRLFAVILVSNSRALSFFPEKEAVIVNFKAYDAAALKKIGEEAMQQHLVEKTKAHALVMSSGVGADHDAANDGRAGRTSSTSSLPSADPSTSPALSVAPAAVAFAAKTALLQHGGDARKVQEICRRAVDETHRGDASVTSFHPPPSRASASLSSARKTLRGALTTVASNTKTAASSAACSTTSAAAQQRKKRGRSDEDGDPVVPSVTTVTLSHVMSAARDVTRPDAVLLVQSLPELTTYVLCCVVAVARRHAIEEYFRRVHVGGCGERSRKEDDVLRAVQNTNHKGVKDCGQIRAQEVHRTYSALMNKLLFPPSSFEAVLRSLEDLSGRRVITRPDLFVVTGEWSLVEMEEALLQRGKDVARRDAELATPLDESERAGLAMSNKFESAIRALSCIV